MTTLRPKAAPSVAYSITVRILAPAGGAAVSQLTRTVEAAGGAITALDVSDSGHEQVQIDVTIGASSTEHAAEVVEALAQIPGVKVGRVSDRTFLLHLGGKLETAPRHQIRNRDDLSMIYTPGVARVCLAIAENPEDARRLTIKRNSVAVVTDGTAVLGLGDIGPLAAMPVMEGKAVLFKRFADIDAWPLCLDTTDVDEIVAVVKAVAPGFAGINLEDISAPRCFEIEARLREALDIPVFHDDQHGTAIVVLAALYNALRVVEKELSQVRIVMSGAGAAGTAILKVLLAAGARHVVVADIAGVVHRDRAGLNDSLRWVAEHTNPEGLTGTLKQALAGADVFVGVSAPGVIDADDVATMAERSVVFALANPTPEIDPAEASVHAEVVATGRSDFPNQINNVLAFPGVFRGLLDARSHDISMGLLIAAARALAGVVADDQLNASYITPSVFHPDVHDRVAAAVREAAGGSAELPEVAADTQL
ncbi:NAD-dependent malic enzyme [Auraticoccus monumenti]|uniref:Malate dehydrogenase (Oxaloacetate-decarboxylating) n=1 Tax=Auraticoccus monumenti TaxID=675864 RepID=A0A1G7E4N7_9ACTN|nr:NAD-dependent malic enzyme [Auraticoccus monumenti]SDE58559.1 malate dehydrogenase (oxaloacetate-decarboxylating) [Auraticoccus monumenti]